jgi:hypothetical protein
LVWGPNFFTKGEKHWPKISKNLLLDTEEELRSCRVKEILHKYDIIDPARFSNWYRLLRTMGWVIRFRNNLLKKLKQYRCCSEKKIELSRILV